MRVGLGVVPEEPPLVVQQERGVFYAIRCGKQNRGEDMDFQFFRQGAHTGQAGAVLRLCIAHHIRDAAAEIPYLKDLGQADEFCAVGCGFPNQALRLVQVGLDFKQCAVHLDQRQFVTC